MFGFLKPKVTIPELAEQMFKCTLNFNDEYDKGILEKAKSSGYDVYPFSFEYLCLRMFSTVLYVCNALPPTLRGEFLDKWFECNRLYTDSLGMEQVVPVRTKATPDGEMRAAHDLMTDRLSMYYKLAADHPLDHAVRIAERFSELCSGNPKNDWLTHVGGSTFVLRGNAALEYLKSVKICPPGTTTSRVLEARITDRVRNAG
jgi:hypothetical protein